MSEDYKTPTLPGIEPKFIQIATAATSRVYLYALDEAGDIWWRDGDNIQWVKMNPKRKEE